MSSEGHSNMIEDGEISQIAGERISIEEKAKKLIEAANDHGGKDNIAVILIDVFAKE